MFNRLFNFFRLYDDNNINYDTDAYGNDTDDNYPFSDAFIIITSLLACILSIACTVQIFI